MYDYIKGSVVYVNKNEKNFYFVVDVNGLGFRLEANQKTINALGELNSCVKIYTTMVHKEDDCFLCGFLSKEQRDIFNILISVSGVGRKSAFLILDKFDVADIISIVLDENSKALAKAKGIGEKSAMKIIIELKDKLINFKHDLPKLEPGKKQAINSSEIQDAYAILLSLGYSKEEIEMALEENKDKNFENENVEEILKTLLKNLASC